MNKNIFVYFLVAIFATSSALAAGGLGLSPSIIQEDDAVRGETYIRSLKVLSDEPEDRVVTLSVSGDGTDWISFKDPDTLETISGPTTIPANEERFFIVEFAIPEDLANGMYEGHFEVVPELEEGVRSQVSLVIRTVYRFDVSGDERKTGTVSSITARDTESGQELRIRYDFQNTGNVGFAPSAKVTIQKDGESIDTFEQEGESTLPGDTVVQVATWDTEGRGTGAFSASVIVLADGVQIDEGQLEFLIEPRGTFTANFISGQPELPEKLIAGKPSKGTLIFHNVGKIDLTAKLQFEVYQDDEFVDVIEGQELLVPPAVSNDLEFYFKPTEAGEYVLKGKLLYSGREEALDDLTVTVKSAETVAVNDEGFDEESSESGFNWMLYGGIGIALLVVLFLLFRKK